MSLIRRNIFWLIISQLATWVATLVALIVVPNRLGSTDLGSYGYGTGYVMFFTLAAGLGTSAYLSRAIARDYSVLGRYVWNAVLLKIVLWAVLAVMALALAYAIGNRGETLAIIAISLVGMLPFILTEVFSGALGGMQRLARPAMWMVVQVYYQTVFGILVLALGWGVIAYTAVMTSGILIPMVATWSMVRPMLRGHRIFDFKIWRMLVVGGIPLLALTFFNLIYGTVDTPILYNMAGGDPVGWYSVAFKWVGIPVFLTTAVVASYFPAFSQHGNPLTDEFAPLVNRAIQIVLVVTIPASFGLALVADDMIRFVYSSEFDSSIVLIQILAIQVPISAMDTVLATALMASDRLNRYLAVAAIAAVVNPIACVVAIGITDRRYGNGAIGAAIITVATELWVMLGALHFRVPGVLDRTEVGRIVRITVATATMAPVLLLAGDWPLPVQVVLGVVTYAVASLAFRVFTIAELREVTQQMRRGRRRERLDDEPDEGSVDDGTGVGPTHTPRVGGDLHPQS
jgi:O-antigen/teichoic acid export membrane protein